jgi:predicted nucleic acid-binding protein
VILLDTAPIVALCDPRDGLNRTALRDLDRLAREPLFLCTPVLTEACFLLRHAMQRARLQRMLAELSIHAYRGDDEARLWVEVFDWMADYQDHDPDWTDGYLAVITGKERRFKLWTYDREFRTTWRRPDGTAIPLATSRYMR